jgi:hypothetical protein
MMHPDLSEWRVIGLPASSVLPGRWTRCLGDTTIAIFRYTGETSTPNASPKTENSRFRVVIAPEVTPVALAESAGAG